jgi:hypothetical protein
MMPWAAQEEGHLKSIQQVLLQIRPCGSGITCIKASTLKIFVPAFTTGMAKGTMAKRSGHLVLAGTTGCRKEKVEE